jgi:hypothetical protein
MQPQFSVEGALTPDHLRMTDEILRASMTVDQEILDKVVAI